MERNNSDGFTLFELIVVLVIVGFMALFAVPRFFNSMTNVELKIAAKETVSLLRQARNVAYFKKMKVNVHFDRDAGLVTAKKNSRTDELIKNLRYTYPSGINISQFRDINGENLHESFKIQFMPNGSSSGGNVSLRNEKKQRYEIAIDMITGIAHIQH